jgi:putative aldouronate transport system substrate-binding protein
MKRNKLMPVVLSVLMTTSVFFGACSSKPTETVKNETDNTETTKTEETKPAEKPDPFGKYDPPIEQTSIRILTSWMALDEGDDENNNVWTRAMKDKLGIEVKQLWTAPDWGSPFDEKVNLAIATDQLPDNIPVYTTLFYRMVEGKKLADLTKVYEDYASPKLKEIMEMGNGVGLKSSTFDGKLYGLGQPNDYSDRTFLWLRKDWLDKLGLQPPKTMDELYAVAKAFVEKDPNGNGKKDEIGFEITKDFFGGPADPKVFFNAYGLYPRTWVEKDGKLVRGETQPEFKEVLKKMAELYKEGLIPKDFTVKDANKECQEDVIAGKVGIAFGSAGMPDAPQYKDSNAKVGAQWEAYDMPTATGELLKAQFDSRVGNFLAASAKNKNPEAVIKMLNLQLEIDAFNKEYVTDNTFNMSPKGNMNFWCKPANINDPRNALNNVNAILEAMKTGDATKLQIDQKEGYDKVKSGDWAYSTMYKAGGAEEMRVTKYKDAQWVSPAWGAETPAWVQSGQDLHVKAQEFFIKAVTTGNVDKEFDEWVNYWNTQGGAEATNEMNEWYEQNK